MYKIDHVFTHGRARDAVDEAAVFEPRVLCLNLLDDLLSERANLGRARDRHVVRALVPAEHVHC